MSEAQAHGADFARAGGCLCGAVALSIGQPAQETYHCHCSMCRRVSGSLYQSFSSYGVGAVAIVKGEEHLRTYRSSPGVRRMFCDRCGCQVLCEDDKMPGIVLVNSGVLEGGKHPGHPTGAERHIFIADKVSWLHLGDDLPKFEVT